MYLCAVAFVVAAVGEVLPRARSMQRSKMGMMQLSNMLPQLMVKAYCTPFFVRHLCLYLRRILPLFPQFWSRRRPFLTLQDGHAISPLYWEKSESVNSVAACSSAKGWSCCPLSMSVMLTGSLGLGMGLYDSTPRRLDAKRRDSSGTPAFSEQAGSFALVRA